MQAVSTFMNVADLVITSLMMLFLVEQIYHKIFRTAPREQVRIIKCDQFHLTQKISVET